MRDLVGTIIPPSGFLHLICTCSAEMKRLRVFQGCETSYQSMAEATRTLEKRRAGRGNAA